MNTRSTKSKSHKNVNSIPFFIEYLKIFNHLPEQTFRQIRPDYSILNENIIASHSLKLGQLSNSNKRRVKMEDLNKITKEELDKFIVKDKKIRCSRYSDAFVMRDRVLTKDSRINSIDSKAVYFDFSQMDDKTFACSAPTSSNMGEWWENVILLDIKMITMLTSSEENGKEKSAQYFPMKPRSTQSNNINSNNINSNNNEISRSDFLVLSENKNILAVVCNNLTENFENIEGLELRDLQIVEIEKIQSVEGRYKILSIRHNLIHLYYSGWKDHKVIDPINLLELITKYSALYSKIKSNNLIHCSAGIGRTGTFYVTMRLLRHIILSAKKYKCYPLDTYINIPEYILIARRCRMGCVQTESQIILIYQTLKVFSDKFVLVDNPYRLES